MEDSEKRAMESLFNKMRKCSKRYIEAEQFILNLNWFERLFCSGKILKFIKSRSKYNF